VADDPFEKLRRKLDEQSAPRHPAPVVAPPRPGSHAPTAGPHSLPPEEEAPDPKSAHAAREHARRKAAEQDARERDEDDAFDDVESDTAVVRKAKGVNWLWLFQSKEGRFVLKLLVPLTAGGTWTQVREPVLAALGIASTSELRASEDRDAKRLKDLEAAAVDRRIEAQEFRKQTDAITTRQLTQTNDIAELGKRVPKVEGKP
jgi:heme/copper-type cytochrome/quinol oxidase subunit 2